MQHDDLRFPVFRQSHGPVERVLGRRRKVTGHEDGVEMEARWIALGGDGDRATWHSFLVSRSQLETIVCHYLKNGNICRLSPRRNLSQSRGIFCFADARGRSIK